MNKIQKKKKTSTWRGAFPHQYVYERDPEFSDSSGVDTEIPWLEIRSDFPEVAWMQARVASY